jgi:hypothetical protein
MQLKPVLGPVHLAFYVGANGGDVQITVDTGGWFLPERLRVFRPA